MFLILITLKESYKHFFHDLERQFKVFSPPDSQSWVIAPKLKEVIPVHRKQATSVGGRPETEIVKTLKIQRSYMMEAIPNNYKLHQNKNWKFNGLIWWQQNLTSPSCTKTKTLKIQWFDMMVAKPNTKTKPLKIQWFDMMAAKPNITLTSGN